MSPELLCHDSHIKKYFFHIKEKRLCTLHFHNCFTFTNLCSAWFIKKQIIEGNLPYLFFSLIFLINTRHGLCFHWHNFLGALLILYQEQYISYYNTSWSNLLNFINLIILYTSLFYLKICQQSLSCRSGHSYLSNICKTWVQSPASIKLVLSHNDIPRIYVQIVGQEFNWWYPIQSESREVRILAIISFLPFY